MRPIGIGALRHAMAAGGDLFARLVGRRPAVFLDYDGTLTPIVDRPEEARITVGMRNAVSRLAERCPVCVVSGRDRPVVQDLMGIDDLIVAGSHGFDIWSPAGGSIQRDQGAGSRALMAGVEARLRELTAPIAGALVEPKSASVAAHYRLVSEPERPRIREIVDGLLAENPGRLKVTPGKMVFEIQPDIDWDKGRAVRHLLEALDLDREDVVPLYLGDDITDEDAFQALAGRGIGILVGSADDPEMAGRATAAGYVLHSVEEVERFLTELTSRLEGGRVTGAG